MKYKVEIFDNVEYLGDVTGFNDHQLHCVIYLKNQLNTNTMEKAVKILIKTIPILSRVYRNYGGDCFWEDTVNPDWKDLFTIVHNKEDFDKFTFSKTDEATGPQIKVCLLQSDNDTLSIIMNHMVGDAASFKQSIYLLADIYSNLIKDQSYVPDYIIDGDRSIKSIAKKVGFFYIIKSLFFGSKDNNLSTEEFPFSKEEEVSPFIAVHEILPDTFCKVRNLCKSDNVTINDVIITAYLRVLSEELKLNGKELDLPFMIDMRKYLEDKSFHSLANLSSTATLSSNMVPGEDFRQSLNRVSAAMNAKKSEYLGMHTVLNLSMLSILFPKKSYSILEDSLNNPKICMTNIGVLDSERLLFGESKVTNVIMCGSIKYRPHLQISVSTFNDKMTFCVNLYGSKSDHDKITRFLKAVDNELVSYVDLQD